MSATSQSSLGEPVDPTPARRPERIVLAGRYVTLTPLDPARHGDELYRDTSGAGRADLWRYLFDGPFETRDAFQAALLKKAASDDPLFLSVIDRGSGRAVGYASYMRIEPFHKVIEVGSILYTPLLQQTVGGTEAMYLMARHVFEDLGYRRYEWKCNSDNAPSRRAALRLGFQFEGIFRQHMIVKGSNRDTAWFAMIDKDWPRCKQAFEQWLDPGNFDPDGKQRAGLAALREERDGAGSQI